MTLTLFLVFIALVSGCQTSAKKGNPIKITVEMPEPNEVKFSGKGRDTGLKFSDKLGTAAMAVGLAVDDGIGKRLNKRLQEREFDVSYEIANKVAKINRKLGHKSIDIRVRRYGFLRKPGTGDFAWGQFHVEIKTPNGCQPLVRYPEDFPGTEDDRDFMPLVKLMDEGKQVIKLLKNAMDVSLERWQSIECVSNSIGNSEELVMEKIVVQ